ncbi:DUF6086 family protein [Streptomyces sp. NPDC047315]|uniref:DUF6086 family protein n=1 Tax=Streptomyces sp. NPDC047315 TaxID=3155142 RepID=UPI0033D513C7
MSQYYEMGDETLWNPSNGASRLFMSQVSVYQTELGLPSGIGPMQEDECQIDPVVFKEFVDALLAWHRSTRHAVVASLSEGFVATVLALADRADIEVSAALTPSEGAWAAALQDKSHELSRIMAA